jgi:hypothetical protein
VDSPTHFLAFSYDVLATVVTIVEADNRYRTSCEILYFQNKTTRRLYFFRSGSHFVRLKLTSRFSIAIQLQVKLRAKNIGLRDKSHQMAHQLLVKMTEEIFLAKKFQSFTPPPNQQNISKTKKNRK